MGGSKEAELSARMEDVRAECERRTQGEKEETARKAAEFRAERERLEQEKVTMAQNLEDARQDFEHKMQAEEEAMKRKTLQFQTECESKMEEKEREMARQ